MICTIVLCCIACKDEVKDLTSEEKIITLPMPTLDSSVLEHAVLYEANIRQYSPEGTFDAFTKDIPQLKSLGVKIIWLMPIFPNSEKRRKATGSVFVEDIPNVEEREKYLGSYYSVADYTGINPDLGTADDLSELIQTAHQNDMYVILDWVANHTGWDHAWIREHPEYYMKNKSGEITEPLNEDGSPKGWSDVADLDYNNQAMQTEMRAAMQYWIQEFDIDGYRCDVAYEVPTSFWKETIPILQQEKPIFMLAEAELPELVTPTLFDMSYGWEGHHILNAIAKGEKKVQAFDAYLEKLDSTWGEESMQMNFITNHDENSWAGSVKARMGAASETMLALSYCMPGMPLIYSGQEYDLDRSLKFFEKDSIPKLKGAVWPVLEKLGALKNSIPAMAGGKAAATYERMETSNDDHMLCFRRKKGASELYFIANLSNQPLQLTTPISGSFLNQMTGKTETYRAGQIYEFAPWEYHILTK